MPSLHKNQVRLTPWLCAVLLACGQGEGDTIAGKDAGGTNRATDATAPADDTGSFNNACSDDSDCTAQFPELGPCQRAMCDPATGACVASDRPDGTVVTPTACKTVDGTLRLKAAVQCAGGKVVGGDEETCSGGVCGAPTCDAAAASCGVEPTTGGPCDDGNKCTTGDICKNGACEGVVTPCVAGACETATCQPADGKCVVAPAADGAGCDDGNKCTVQDKCVAGKCAGDTAPCDDANPCTKDACDPAAVKDGCVHSHIDGPCDDGDKCTGGDSCAKGACKGATSLCECQTSADCAATPGDLCAATYTCDKSSAPYTCKIAKPAVSCGVASGPCLVQTCEPASGTCKEVPSKDGKVCSDGDKCTLQDACKAGKCASKGALPCPSGSDCQAVTCDPSAGCVKKPKEGSCDDGSKCTTSDTCKGGACVAGPALGCDDGKACTFDSCAPATGCAHKAAPLDGKSCDDGDACTAGERCKKGACVDGTKKTCDDSKKCTTDQCDPKAGCTHKPIAGCKDCGADPLCVGAPAPTWSLPDLNPTSPWKNQSYGLAKFKGTPTVLFLLHGY